MRAVMMALAPPLAACSRSACVSLGSRKLYLRLSVRTPASAGTSRVAASGMLSTSCGTTPPSQVRSVGACAAVDCCAGVVLRCTIA